MFVLYYSPGSCSTAAHILLEECGADYQVKRVNLAEGEQRTDEYRKINVHGKVPALVINEQIITQNAAILPFISGQFPKSNLTPSDPIDYAKCVELVGWLASAVHPAFGLALHPERPAGGADVEENTIDLISKNGHNIFWNNLEEIDGRLKGKDWVMGAQYTFADPYTLVFYAWGKRLGQPMSQLENYTAWKDRMLARPAVHRVLDKENSLLLGSA
jgi:glutathione S-transferase